MSLFLEAKFTVPDALEKILSEWHKSQSKDQNLSSHLYSEPPIPRPQRSLTFNAEPQDPIPPHLSLMMDESPDIFDTHIFRSYM